MGPTCWLGRSNKTYQVGVSDEHLSRDGEEARRHGALLVYGELVRVRAPVGPVGRFL